MATTLDASITDGTDGTEGTEGTVHLVITNQTGAPAQVLNPNLGHPAEAEHWPHSLEAYRAALLLSFGFLKLQLTTEAGESVPRRPDVATLATPVLKAPVELAPGDTLSVPIPLGVLFPLDPAQRYRLTAEYGDDNTRAAAEAEV